MSENIITVKYKVNVAAYCNWHNLHNLGIGEDEIETDWLAIKDASGVIEEIKGCTIRGAEDYSGSIKNHSFQISSDENEILFTTTFSFDEAEADHDEEGIRSDVFNNPQEEYPDGIMGLWKNEKGDLARPLEIIE